MDDDTRAALPAGTYLTAADRQEAARRAFRASLYEGSPLDPPKLGELFDRSARWANDRITEVRAEEAVRGNGSSAASGERNDPGTWEHPTDEATTLRHSAMGVTPAVRRVTTLAVLAVATVAALASYDHQRQLAELAGEGWRAWLLPLSVDGMVVAASMTMLVRRRSDDPVGALAWIALVLGGAVSVVANVAAAEPTPVGRLVAAWPPVALLVSYELFLQVRAPAPARRRSGQ
jgi:hypothetical protein